jgi:hypothetical protein
VVAPLATAANGAGRRVRRRAGRVAAAARDRLRRRRTHGAARTAVVDGAAEPGRRRARAATPSGQTRRSNQTLPWRQTITLPPGQQVTVLVRSATATSLECLITVDGNQVAKQKSSAPGPVTCEARS